MSRYIEEIMVCEYCENDELVDFQAHPTRQIMECCACGNRVRYGDIVYKEVIAYDDSNTY